MAVSKNRQFAKIANDVTTDGTLAASAISSDVTLGGATIYATRANLPTSGNTAGDQAYVTENNRLYIWNGSGWYNVALLNVAPSIQTVLDSDGNTTPFRLAVDGTATTITITATDSDGDPITYSAVADSDFNGLATINQELNVFTITPFSQDSASTTAGRITFKADDGINIASSGIQTFTLNFLYEFWDETVLSIGTSSTNGLANSTFIDRSTNAHTVTSSGTPVQTAFHPYLDNWSVEFDGSGDYLTVPDDPVFDFDADFTIESWIYWNEAAAQTYTCILGGNGSNSNGWQIYLQSSDGQLLFFYNGFPAGQTVGKVGLNVWSHIAVTRQGSNLRTFLDGIMVYENTSYTTGTLEQQTSNLGTIIGYDHSGDNGYFNGILSNIRIIKGTALYTTSFTPPTEKPTAVSGTSLLTCQSNRFIDNSTNGHTITPAGNVKVSAFNPFGQGSEYASGENRGSLYTTDNSDYITISATQVDLLTASDAFTIETWVYFKSFNTGQYSVPIFRFDTERFIWRATPTTASSTTTNIYQNDNDNRPWGINGTVFGTVYLNQWHHFAMTRESNGTYHFYIDGNRVHTASNPQAFSDLNNLQLGLDLSGYTSDFRSTKSALYTTSTITPPTSPVGNTNASLYLPMDNAGIFDKTGLNTLTPVGNASTSTIQTKFADTAMYFDGSGDCIVIEDSSMFDFGSSDFTIEAWLYNNSTGNMGIFGKRETNIQYGTTNLDINSGKIRFLISLNNSSWSSTSQTSYTVPSNTWWHLALVRDTSNSTLTCYADGNNVGQLTSFTGAFVDTTHPFIVGNSVENFTESPFNGYIENFQILKGVAKYTTNFTPPDRTQGRTYQAES